MNSNELDIQRFLADLVSINSVFPGERNALLFLEERFRAEGLEPKRYPISEDRWNLLVSVGEGSPVVCMNAHIDTMPINGESVPKARVEQGILYGLGSCDDKASIAAMFAALRALRNEKRLPGRVDLLVSVDEEHDALGVRTAVRDGYRCDFAIVGEPTSLDILTLHGGLLFMELEVCGVSAHGSAPWNGTNAVEETMTLVEELRATITGMAEPDPMIGRASLNLGAISAGDAPNRVPDLCKALLDIRLVPPLTISQVHEGIDQVLAQPRWERASYRILKEGDVFVSPEDSRVVSALERAGNQVRRKNPRRDGRRYWTEADPMRNLAGADVAVCGPGDIRQAHSANEFVALSEVFDAAQIYYHACRELLAMEG